MLLAPPGRGITWMHKDTPLYRGSYPINFTTKAWTAAYRDAAGNRLCMGSGGVWEGKHARCGRLEPQVWGVPSMTSSCITSQSTSVTVLWLIVLLEFFFFSESYIVIIWWITEQNVWLALNIHELWTCIVGIKDDKCKTSVEHGSRTGAIFVTMLIQKRINL